jgi:sucrose-6-phosphate hydrolase SacC (GH32 family)
MMMASKKGRLDTMLKETSRSDDTVDRVAAQRALRETMLADPHRPTYHFVSPEGICGPFDPNGAIYWNGRYHLGYIFQNELGHCWGHASSADLLHWRHHSPMLVPNYGDVDRGIFSGNSFVGKGGEAVTLYHGVDAGNCIATSTETDLEHWTKLPSNPIVPIPEKGSSEEKLYRSWDPHGWLEDDTYYAIFGGGGFSGSAATIFKADTLDDWQYVGPLFDEDMPEVDDFEDVSCPDFFKLGNKHALLCISHPRGARIYLGDWKDEKFYPESHQRMNWPGGTFFAPESCLDKQGRRIFWAWVLDCKSADHGWSGTMSLPRILSLPEDGVLRIEPIPELRQLRQNERMHKNIRVEAGKAVRLDDIQGSTLELALTIDPGKAESFGVKVCVSPDGQEQTVIKCNPTAGILSVDIAQSTLDKSVYYKTFAMNFMKLKDNHDVTRQVAPFTLQPGEKLNLRIFIDRSILEVFANDRQCITQMIYPTREDSVGVELFSDGGTIAVESLHAWDMAAPNPW